MLRKDTAEDLFLILRSVMMDGEQASTALKRLFSAKGRATDVQKALISNVSYDVIRNWRLLWTSLGREPSFEGPDLWHLLGAYEVLKGREVVPRGEFRNLRPMKVAARIRNSHGNRAVQGSVPDWMDRLCETELGDRWDPVLSSLNRPAPIALRANTLLTSLLDLQKALRRRGLGSTGVPWAPDALVLERKANVFSFEEFRKGSFEVQDPSSQAVSRFLAPEKGMLVVDACAGQGGKTLHMAALMENKGRIIAMDDTGWKLRELRKRAARASAQNIETREVAGSKDHKRLNGMADRLLLDVPCSGLGSLRRNPEIRWHLDMVALDRLKALQQELLRRYSPILKDGGRMVYSTCSILPSEGEGQVASFMKDAKGYRLIEERRLWPDTDGFDGFYMALIEKDPKKTPQDGKL